jgi:hypothetical protein
VGFELGQELAASEKGADMRWRWRWGEMEGRVLEEENSRVWE